MKAEKIIVPPRTLAQEVAVLQAAMARFREDSAADFARLRAQATEALQRTRRTDMTALRPDRAAEATRWTHLLMSLAEAKISELGLDRQNVADRRRAVETVLAEAPADVVNQMRVVDVDLVVNGFAPSQSTVLPNAANVVPPGGSLAPSREAVDAGIASAPSSPVTQKMSEAPPLGLYGFDVERARALGGEDRLRRLKEIARRERLDLNRHYGYAQATRLLYDELRASVATARTYDEAVRAAEREKKITLHEGTSREDRRALLDAVARARPDLVGSFGSAKDTRVDAATRSRHPDVPVGAKLPDGETPPDMTGERRQQLLEDALTEIARDHHLDLSARAHRQQAMDIAWRDKRLRHLFPSFGGAV